MYCKAIKSLFLALLITVPLLSSATPAVTPFEAVAHEDSLSMAYGVIVADYLRPDIPADSALVTSYISGLNDALSSDKPSQYYYGVINGLGILSRVKAMSDMGVTLDAPKVLDVVASILSGKSSALMSNEEANAVLNAFIASQFEVLPDSVSAESQQAYIDSVAKVPGAIMLESGVVLIPVKVSQNGAKPGVGDKVLVSYTGSLSDGTVFDSTEKPIEMVVGGLVPGFNEALLNMTTGSTLRAVIPASQAYGERGVPGAIPGNALLDFVITLEQIIN